MKSKFTQSAHSLLTHTLAFHLEDVDYLGLIAVGHSRANKKHPDHATLELAFPDAWLVNALGDEKFADTYFLVKIDRVAVDAWMDKCRALRSKRDNATQNPPEDSEHVPSSSEELSPATAVHASTFSSDNENMQKVDIS